MVRRNFYANKPQILKALFNFSAIKIKGLLLVTKRIRQSREGFFPTSFSNSNYIVSGITIQNFPNIDSSSVNFSLSCLKRADLASRNIMLSKKKGNNNRKKKPKNVAKGAFPFRSVSIFDRDVK